MGRRRLAVVGALLLALVGAGLLGVAALRSGSPPQPPAARASARPHTDEPSRVPASRVRGVEDRTRGLVLPVSDPVRLSVPRLRIATPLVRLGVDGAGAMEVPSDPAVPGWYHLGPAPGSLGPAVIAGHVTWNRAPAVFFALATMHRGDRVRVLRRDGTVAVFAVRNVSRFVKTHFPTRRVFGAIDHAGLRLITCGGTYDAAAHRYLDNVVVFADLVATHRVAR